MGAQDGRRETELERLDRNLEELNGELRVVVTGVQVLLGFLLVVPFQASLERAAALERVLWLVGLGATALSALLLIAPTARHRVLFRDEDKRSVVFVGNRLTLAGLACLGVGTSAAVAMAVDRVVGAPGSVAVLVVALAGFGTLWFALPLRRRARIRS